MRLTKSFEFTAEQINWIEVDENGTLLVAVEGADDLEKLGDGKIAPGIRDIDEGVAEVVSQSPLYWECLDAKGGWNAYWLGHVKEYGAEETIRKLLDINDRFLKDTKSCWKAIAAIAAAQNI